MFAFSCPNNHGITKQCLDHGVQVVPILHQKRWDYLPFLTQTVTENGGCDMGVSENGDNPKLQCNMEHDSFAPARGTSDGPSDS